MAVPLLRPRAVNNHGNRSQATPGIAPQTAAHELEEFLASGQGAAWRRFTYHDQCELLINWAKTTKRLLDADRWLKPARFGGKEHHIWFHESSQHVIKVTHSEAFGRFPVLDHKSIRLREANLREYLHRLTLSNWLFGDSMFVVGVAVDDERHPRVVTAQPAICGTRPAPGRIDDYFTKLGFEPTESPTIFYRASDRMACFDAHAGNLVEGKRGKNVYAIDIVIDEVGDGLAGALENSVSEAKGR